MAEQPDWNRVEEIYHAALELPRSQRIDYVRQVSGNDSAVFHAVIKLLDQRDLLSGFLEDPIVELGSNSQTSNLLGKTIEERYFVEKELGHGGMSEVYLARDLRLNRREVVLKVLARELFENSYARQKFEQEVEALSRIRHSNVVEVLDKGALPDDRPFLVMQFIEGNTLRSHITSQGMNHEQSASILKQISRALEHVHEKSVFHRDLKPENVMLKSNTNSVVLVDFGIAKVKNSFVAATTAESISAGTLLYMSPEQIRGEELTAASDIYSMGVVAFEMLTGRRPFNATSQHQLLELQKKGVRVKPRNLCENLSTRAQNTILRALSYDPKDRHSTASEFGEQLEQALVHPEVGTRQIPARKVIIAALLFLVVGLTSLGIYKYLTMGVKLEPNRSFTYFLTVQKLHDGQPYEDPVKSNGVESFGEGDMFRLTTFAPVPGYLYIFREGSPEPTETTFAIIYPRAAINSGSASLGADQPVESEWFTFRGRSGSENFWIVWSESPVPQLDTPTTEAFKNDKRGLDPQTLVSVKEYLTTKQSETDVTTSRYKETQKAVVRGRSDVLVVLAQFKYR